MHASVNQSKLIRRHLSPPPLRGAADQAGEGRLFSSLSSWDTAWDVWKKASGKGKPIPEKGNDITFCSVSCCFVHRSYMLYTRQRWLKRYVNRIDQMMHNLRAKQSGPFTDRANGMSVRLCGQLINCFVSNAWHWERCLYVVGGATCCTTINVSVINLNPLFHPIPLQT